MNKITLSKESYKGVDGASLSPTRNEQLIRIFDMLEQEGDRLIDYTTLQSLAHELKIFGRTDAHSAIRTIFPLLKKINFIYNYEDTFFHTNSIFTKLGRSYVYALKLRDSIINLNEDNTNAIICVNNLIKDIIKQGLLDMYKSGCYVNHNIWLTLKLLKALNRINIKIYVYSLYLYKELGMDFDQVINKIKEKEEELNSYQFYKSNGTPIADTCFSYIKSLLIEANLVEEKTKNYIYATENTKQFNSLINL